MLLVNINKKEYKIAEAPAEMLARQYVNFTKAHSKIVLSDDDLYTNTVELAKCLCEYLDLELEDLAEFEANNETTESYLKGVKEIEDYSSIAGLVAHIANVIMNYKAKTDFEVLSFNYRGYVWSVPHFKASEFTGKIIRPNMKFGDVVRISEAKRVASTLIGKLGKDGKDLDPNGNAQISELLYIVSYLAENKEVDPYLTDINQRIEYFKDIDMQTALDLLFFLINIGMNSKEMQDSISSLIHQQSHQKTNTKVTLWQKLKQTLKRFGKGSDG
jgi:hypothetical protein